VALLAGASDVDNGASLSVATVTYTLGGVATGNDGADLPAGVSLVGSTLTVNPADYAFQSFAAGVVRTIVATYNVIDGLGGTVAQTATITITGTNDAAVIGGVTIGAVIEDTEVGSGNITAAGTLTSTDADGVANAFMAGAGVAVGSTLGSLSIDAEGAWS
jgi:VCBS repeat-containing protein